MTSGWFDSSIADLRRVSLRGRQAVPKTVTMTERSGVRLLNSPCSETRSKFIWVNDASPTRGERVQFSPSALYDGWADNLTFGLIARAGRPHFQNAKVAQAATTADCKSAGVQPPRRFESFPWHQHRRRQRIVKLATNESQWWFESTRRYFSLSATGQSPTLRRSHSARSNRARGTLKRVSETEFHVGLISRRYRVRLSDPPCTLAGWTVAGLLIWHTRVRISPSVLAR